LFLKSSIITTDLNKRPEKLPEALWKILRKFSLARTPQEERIRLFENSETVGINEDPFVVFILRALSAALSLDRRMEHIRVQFVKGGDTEIDLLFKEEEQLLLVHEKWLDFQRIHEGASCEMSRLARERPVEKEAFSCDHVVEDLFELAINEIRGPLNLDQSESVTLRRVARERIRQIPRLIKVLRTCRANDLEVSWSGNESVIISKKYGANILYHVILHKMSTCWPKKGELLHQAGTYPFPGGALQIVERLLMTLDAESAPAYPGSSSHPLEATNASCGCARQVASQSDTKATFSDLDHREEYFPMIARTRDKSFFGIPPAPVAPEAATDSNAASPAPMINPEINRNSQPPPEQQDIVANDVPLELFGSNEDEEDEDTPVHTPTRKSPVNADTSHPRPQARSSHRRQESRDTDAVDSLAWNQDEKTWQTWHEQELPGIFSRLIPKCGTRSLVWKAPMTYCTNSTLE